MNTHKNNLVILCEGTDTEYNYFINAKEYVERKYPDRFAKIKVVPICSEIIKTKNSTRKGRKTLNSVTDMPHYWCLEEHSVEEYERYKQQPTRYVRETQLYLEDEGFIEGWAVFDKDVHPDHANAFELATVVPNLHIAFSSYCFEEWLLAHFERNTSAYMHSECMLTKHQTKMCGTGVADDCCGTICLGGRLRKENYIPDYSKSNKNLFEKYTLPRLEVLFINAAWLRNLEENLIYQRNPYTNVDALIARLLDKQESYEWRSKNTMFDYAGTQLMVTVTECNMMIRNCGTRSCIITPQSFFFTDEHGLNLSCVTPDKQMIESESMSESMTIPLHCKLLLIKEGNRYLFIAL